MPYLRKKTGLDQLDFNKTKKEVKKVNLAEQELQN